MSACVSPPHDSTSHIVAVAASMAAAASIALPPFWNIIAPAVAPSGLPVMAIQCFPCSGGFWVCRGRLSAEGRRAVVSCATSGVPTQRAATQRRVRMPTPQIRMYPNDSEQIRADSTLHAQDTDKLHDCPFPSPPLEHERAGDGQQRERHHD